MTITHTPSERAEIAASRLVGLRPLVRCQCCGKRRLCQENTGTGHWWCEECRAVGSITRSTRTCSPAAGSGDGHVIRKDQHSGG